MKKLSIGWLLFALVVMLTFAVNVETGAQDHPTAPLFINTTRHIYAVYPFENRHTVLEIPATPLNMLLSPDGSTLLVDTLPDPQSTGRTFYAIDTKTLDFRLLPLAQVDAEVNGQPLWRWDSDALLYVEYSDGTAARVVEFDIETSTQTVRVDHLSCEETACDHYIPYVVWWSSEGFGVARPTASGSAPIQSYDLEGNAVSQDIFRLNLNTATAELIQFKLGEETWLATHDPAIPYHLTYIFQPMTGGGEPLGGVGTTIAQFPIGVLEPTYILTLNQDKVMPRHRDLATTANSDWRAWHLASIEPIPLLSISPDGEYYSQLDQDGLSVIHGDTKVPVDLPVDTDAALTWEAVWSPLEWRTTSLGRFYIEEGNQLIIETYAGNIPIGRSGSIWLWSQAEYLIWMGIGENGEGELHYFHWETGKTTKMFDDLPSVVLPTGEIRLPEIVSYDNGTMTIELEGSQIQLPSASVPWISQTPELLAPLESPIFIRPTYGNIYAFDSRTGTRVPITFDQSPDITHLSVSPDASRIVVTPTYWDCGRSDCNFEIYTRIYQSQGLQHTFSTFSEYFNERIIDPIWRWDSQALIWVDYGGFTTDKPFLVEYDILTNERSVLIEALPFPDNGELSALPQPIWWTPDGIAMRYSGDGIKEHILVYDASGVEQRQIQISDLATDADSQVTTIIPVAIDGRTEIGLFYPEQRKWKLLDPMTGELQNLAPDEWIAEVPMTNIEGTRYGKIIAPEGGEHIIEFAPNSDTASIIEATSSGLSISPDGQYYSYLTDEALMVGGAETHLVLETEPQGIGPDSVSWSPLIGVVIPKPTP